MKGPMYKNTIFAHYQNEISRFKKKGIFTEEMEQSIRDLDDEIRKAVINYENELKNLIRDHP